MTEKWKLEDALRDLYGRVDLSGVWADIEARAASGRGSKGKAEPKATQHLGAPQVRSRRLRMAVCIPVALLLVAAIAIGTAFAVDRSQQAPAVVGGGGTETTTTTAAPADYSRGGSWKRLALSGAGGQVTRLVIDPADHQVLYAVTQEGLYKTSDGAGMWKKIVEFTGQPEIAVDPASPSTIYLISPDPESPKLQRSDDGGASWKDLDASILLDSAHQSEYVFDGASFGPAVTVGSEQASTIYIDADSGTWRSVDQGANWSKTDRDEMTSTAVTLVGDHAATSPLGLRDKTIEDVSDGSSAVVEVDVADPDDASVVYAGTRGGGVYKSVDGGVTWHRTSMGITALPVYSLIPDPVSPSILYAVTEFGIQKSATGGATWTLILAGGEYTGGFIDFGDGRVSRVGSMTSMVVAPSSPSTLYAWNGDGISRSDDGGATWVHKAGEGLLSVGLEPTGSAGSLAMVGPDDPDIVFAETHGGLFRSADGGDTWTACADTAEVSGLLVDRDQPSVMYMVGYFKMTTPLKTAEDFEAYRNRPRYLFKSVDAGVTWTPVLNTKETGLSGIFTLDSHIPTRLYSWVTDESDVRRAKVMRSLDGGATWQQMDFSGLGPSFEEPLFDRRSPDTVYERVLARSDDDYTLVGIFRSTDGGTTWENAGNGPLAGGIEFSLALSPADGTLYACSWQGLFKWVPND